VRVKIGHVNCKSKKGFVIGCAGYIVFRVMDLTLIIVRIKIRHVICKLKRGFVISCAGYVV
jgi:hypothetical protein